MSSHHDLGVQLGAFLLVMVVIDSLCSSHNYLDACLIDSTHSLMIRSEDNIKGVHEEIEIYVIIMMNIKAKSPLFTEGT